jgi:hypothetical protein
MATEPRASGSRLPWWTTADDLSLAPHRFARISRESGKLGSEREVFLLFRRFSLEKAHFFAIFRDFSMRISVTFC